VPTAERDWTKSSPTVGLCRYYPWCCKNVIK
jgi:hypothetical protein